MKRKKKEKDYNFQGIDGMLLYEIHHTDIDGIAEEDFEGKVDYLLKLGIKTHNKKEDNQ